MLVASLLHPDEKSVTRQKPNTQKSKDLSEAIAQVGRDNLAGTKKLTKAIESVAGAMSKSGKITSEVTDIRSEISNIKSSLSEIMDFLKNNK